MGVTCWVNSDELQGSVKILEQRQYAHSSPWASVATWEYDRMGKETRVHSGGEREGLPISSITSTNFFDDQGQKAREIRKWNNGSPAGEVLYAYDDKGNQNVEVWYDGKGSFISLDFREFDEFGNCTKDYVYRARGDLNLSIQGAEYLYDKLGKKVEKVFWNNDETKEINRYSERGKLLEIRSYSANGALDREIHITYDLHGNEKESRTLDSLGKLISRTKNTYEYDEKKNWVKRISQWDTLRGKPSEEITVTDRTITYYVPSDTSPPN